jgi:hypothetical protein
LISIIGTITEEPNPNEETLKRYGKYNKKNNEESYNGLREPKAINRTRFAMANLLYN